MASASNSSSLQDFVKEQKHRKGTSFSKLQAGFDDLKAKIGGNGVSTSGYLPLPTWSGFFGGGNGENGAESSADPFSSPTENEANSTSGTEGKKAWLSDDCCGLSRTQRFIGFFTCIIAGLFCFGVASMYIPLLLLKARKFAALNTLGSGFFICSFALLWGPASYVKHLFSQPRLPVTIAYFSTLLATLYSSLWMMSTILTVVFASAQCAALIWFVLSYIPGGERGLKFMTGLCSRLVRRKASGKTSVLPM